MIRESSNITTSNDLLKIKIRIDKRQRTFDATSKDDLSLIQAPEHAMALLPVKYPEPDPK